MLPKILNLHKCRENNIVIKCPMDPKKTHNSGLLNSLQFCFQAVPSLFEHSMTAFDCMVGVTICKVILLLGSLSDAPLCKIFFGGGEGGLLLVGFLVLFCKT